MPPVVRIAPRVLPQAVDPEGPERRIHSALSQLAAEEQRQEELDIRAQEQQTDRDFQKEMARLRAELEADLSGTFEERAALRRDVQGTFDERATAELGAIETRGAQERMGIRLRGDIEAPFRERELDIRARGADISALDSLRRFNLGLADINQRNQAARLSGGGSAFPLSGLASNLAQGQFGEFRQPTADQITGLMLLARGDPNAARLLGGPRSTAPPDQGLEGMDRVIGVDPGTSFDLEVPSGVGPDSHISFMENFLDSDEQRQIYLNSLPPEQRAQVEATMGAP